MSTTKTTITMKRNNNYEKIEACCNRLMLSHFHQGFIFKKLSNIHPVVGITFNQEALFFERILFIKIITIQKNTKFTRDFVGMKFENTN